MFRVGQRVECVDDSPDRFGRALLVKKGDQFTIASVFIFRGKLGLRFVEIDPGIAAGWLASHFRPIVERKTDISIFQKMLTPSDEEILETAR
jgi:hypothetical protein